MHAMVDAQIVLGNSLKQLFEGLIENDKIFVVPNGRDFDIDVARQKSGNPLQVLFSGKLDSLKGFSRSAGGGPGCA